MKTIILDRAHEEGVNEIPQLSIQSLLVTYSQPTLHSSLIASPIPASHATTSQLILKTNPPRFHCLNYTNSMETKRDKEAINKYLLLSFSKDIMSIEIWYVNFIHHRNYRFIYAVSQFNDLFWAPCIFSSSLKLVI